MVRVVRVGRLYIEQLGNDLMIVDYNETSYTFSAIACVLNPEQAVQLKQVLDGRLKEWFAKKYCSPCVNYDEQCRLDVEDMNERLRNGKSFFAPKASVA